MGYSPWDCKELDVTEPLTRTLYCPSCSFPGGSDSKESACNAGDPVLIHQNLVLVFRYALTCSQVKAMTSSCIALEDSPNGVLSAYRAGCVTVMVPDLTQPDDSTAQIIYTKADSLSDVIDIIEKINCG